jgi:hypothetical protein
MRRTIPLLILLSLCLDPGITPGDTVILRNGRMLKITSYALDGPNLKMQLEGGGEVVCPVYTVRKIEKKSLYSDRKAPADLAEQFGSGREDIYRIIETAADRFDVDARLVAAIVSVESGFNAGAVSPRGAKGLMQLMPETADMYRIKDIFNPEENIECGVRHLKTLMAVYDDNLPLVLAAYNAGQGTVQKYRGIPPYPETRNYIEKVTALYENAAAD